MGDGPPLCTDVPRLRRDRTWLWGPPILLASRHWGRTGSSRERRWSRQPSGPAIGGRCFRLSKELLDLRPHVGFGDDVEVDGLAEDGIVHTLAAALKDGGLDRIRGAAAVQLLGER